MAETTNVAEILGMPYNPAEVSLVINGKPVFGWRNFTVERINPLNTLAPPSADGQSLTIHHADMQGRLTLELLQKSPSLRDILSIIPRETPVSIEIKDKSGTADLATFPEAYLENVPQLQRSEGDNNYRCTFVGILFRTEGFIPQTT